MISPEHKYIWEQTIANMFSNPTYANSYLFYAHMLAQCRVVFDDTMQAPAGVNFMHDHYNLFINPTGFDLTDEQFAAAQSQDPNASKHIPGFCEHPLEHRLGILKHEMLHILFAHIARKEDRDHQLFNVATDCAINQLIERGTPTTITESLKTKIKELLADKSKQNAVLSMQFKDLQELYDYLRKI